MTTYVYIIYLYICHYLDAMTSNGLTKNIQISSVATNWILLNYWWTSGCIFFQLVFPNCYILDFLLGRESKPHILSEQRCRERKPELRYTNTTKQICIHSYFFSSTISNPALILRAQQRSNRRLVFYGESMLSNLSGFNLLLIILWICLTV